MITDEIVAFMNELIKQARDYELVSDDFCEGLLAMAEALKDFDPEQYEKTTQEIINATLLHAADSKNVGR